MKEKLKISFGIIVLNGEPFTRYCLRSIYPFAHEIIVVEGGSWGAIDSTKNGHSTDGTLDILRDFKDKEDPDNKILIVTAEDEGYLDGFWPGDKDEQSQAYAKRATGNYLWQVDVDEFYRIEDIQKIIRRLRDDPTISGMSFKTLCFWGDSNQSFKGGLNGKERMMFPVYLNMVLAINMLRIGHPK